MKLAATIDIYAGGPGSGCNPRAGKCGRPRTASPSGDTVKLQQGDTVVLNKQHKFFHNKATWYRDFPPGTKAKVVEVRPGFALNPEMVRVAPKGTAKDGEWIPRSDVSLHKADVTQIQPKPVKKSQTVKKFTSQDGAQVTIIRPSTAGKFRNPQNLTKEAHTGKGNFKDITKSLYEKGFKGPVKTKIPMYRLEQGILPVKLNADTKVFFWQKTASDKLEGTTVFVHRHWGGKTKGVVIQEFNAGQYGQLTQQSEYRLGQKWQYLGMNEFRYKNFGSAAGLLNKRYGIKIKLKDV